MPHVPDFPSDERDDDRDGDRDRRGIVDRIIGGGEWPVPGGTRDPVV